MNGAWIELCDGNIFDYIYPDYDDISIETIAHSLSLKCRFNGHTKHFYSVAQHCLNVSWAIDDYYPYDKATTKEILHLELIGLLHDSVEVYISDIPSPLKQITNVQIKGTTLSYQQYEEEILLNLIFNLLKRYNHFKYLKIHQVQLGLAAIKEFDLRVRVSERDLLFSGGRIWNKDIPPIILAYREECAPSEIKKIFLKRFDRLVTDINDDGNNNEDTPNSKRNGQ